MKQFFHKILSVAMALVVLFSTMSFTVGMHYCGDVLVDTAVFKDPKSCGMELEQDGSSSTCSIMMKDCCTEKKIVFEGQDELKISFENISFDQQLNAVTLIYSYLNLFDGLEENVTSLLEYPPPLIVKTIYKLDEVYLI